MFGSSLRCGERNSFGESLGVMAEEEEEEEEGERPFEIGRRHSRQNE
jgi:hypothetical protein